MTGPEHYREAERLLDGHPMDQQAALVHSVLALVDATREIGDQLDTLPRRREGMPPLDPPPPGDFECCASGRCEVCSPGYIWGRDR